MRQNVVHTLIQISPPFGLKGPFGKKMQHWPDDVLASNRRMPLCKPMQVLFTGACMRHSAQHLLEVYVDLHMLVSRVSARQGSMRFCPRTYRCRTNNWFYWFHSVPISSSFILILCDTCLRIFWEAITKWIPFCVGHFKSISFNENWCISITISLKFVPKSHIHNKMVLVQILASWLSGDRPLSEPLVIHMMTSSNGNIFRVSGPLCG